MSQAGAGILSYETAWRTLQVYETTNIIRKGQLMGIATYNIQAQNQFISELSGLVS